MSVQSQWLSLGEFPKERLERPLQGQAEEAEAKAKQAKAIMGTLRFQLDWSNRAYTKDNELEGDYGNSTSPTRSLFVCHSCLQSSLATVDVDWPPKFSDIRFQVRKRTIATDSKCTLAHDGYMQLNCYIVLCFYWLLYMVSTSRFPIAHLMRCSKV